MAAQQILSYIIVPKGWQSISVGMLVGCLSAKLQMQCLPGCELVYNRWIILKRDGKRHKVCLNFTVIHLILYCFCEAHAHTPSRDLLNAEEENIFVC